MSFGGLLATALAGGAKVVGEQAGGDIDQRRKEELMREAAAVEEQRQIRVAERIEQLRRQGELANVEGPLADAKLKYRGKEAAQESEAAIARARGMIPVSVKGAVAVEEAKRDVTKKSGADPEYLKALRAIEAAGRAPDRTDYKGRDLDNAIKQIAVDNAKNIAGLKKEFATATPERQKQINEELSVLTGKDTDKFLPVPLKDDMGNVTGYKVFDTKRGAWIDEGKGGGASLADQARAAVAAGADINKVNARLKAAGQPPLSMPGGGDGVKSEAAAPTRKDPISGQPLTEREWDKKYGRGDFKKLYAPGEPALRPF